MWLGFLKYKVYVTVFTEVEEGGRRVRRERVSDDTLPFSSLLS